MIVSGVTYSLDKNNIDIGDSARFELIRDIVKVNLRKSHEASKRRYDLRSRPIQYEVGDVVWKLNKKHSNASKGQSAKLFNKYLKCKVNRKVGSNTYELV